MSDQNLRLLQPVPARVQDLRNQPLGRFLVENGTITSDQLVRALELQLQLGAPIGEILVAEGWADPEDILFALSQQHGLQIVSLYPGTADARLLNQRPAQFWLHHGVIPWMRLGSLVLVATSRPDRFDEIREELQSVFGDVQPVLAAEAGIRRFTAQFFRQELAEAASTRLDGKFSCRTWKNGSNRIARLAVPLAALFAALIAPLPALAIGCVLAVLTLGLFTGLKAAGFAVHLSTHGFISPPKEPALPLNRRLPKISVLVPLFKEKRIAVALVRRLSRLTYPKALLDVVLVLEEHDEVTRETLANTDLPFWMRVIEVPEHEGLTTKPRAMNYALDFCNGDIVGVWDAEDAPEPSQLELVADRFARLPEDVVCLQGILDYYNPRTNWLARCFTIEYSSWFRIVLPGIARLGLVVPLGGTTLFFKRDVLEQLGGWDAHNVTEDADLGVRLCRAGYRTELIETTTFEEANCRPWPWVKQRSRWLKGFMVTWLVHMRAPGELWRDLGWKRFLGFQAFFLGTLGQFLLAPVLWSFWLFQFGFGHPATELLPGTYLSVGAGFLLLFEVLAICIGMTAVSASDRRYLIPWVVTMMAYFPLGVFAAYKALYELIWCPFFWDKTEHGHAEADCGTV